MASLVTIGMATAAGLTSRIMALGLTGRKPTDGISLERMAVTAVWTGAWTLLGWSFVDWRSRQEKTYLDRLQYLIDRKDRRDKWDAIYFSSSSSSANAASSAAEAH